MEPIEYRYRKLYYVTCAVGFYPPGMNRLYKFQFFRKLQWVFLAINSSASYVNLLASAHFLITHSVSTTLLLWLIRRNIVSMGFYGSTVAYYLLTTNRVDKLFQMWNEELHSKYNERRQAIFDEVFKRASPVYIFSAVLQLIPLVIYSTFLLFDRNHPAGRLAIYPHDPSSAFHYPLLILQTFYFVIGTAALIGLHITYIMLLSMAVTDLRILKIMLRESLASEGLRSADITGEQNETFLLREWIQKHRRTKRWIDAVFAHIKYYTHIKFLLLVTYISLSLFTIVKNIKSGENGEIMAIGFMISSFSIIMYQSKLAGDIKIESSTLFSENFDSSWHEKSLKIQKSMMIIQTYCMSQPIELKVLRIYKDNLSQFLKIMQISYQALAFLLQSDQEMTLAKN